MSQEVQPVAISVSSVSKDFNLPHKNQSNSIKSVFINPFSQTKKGNAGSKQHALKHISFEVKQGEFFGIVGRNGSGKSTLLKILAGIYQPNRGSVVVNGKLVPFIELGVGFNPELTGRENVYLSGALMGFSTNEVNKKYNTIVDFAELEKFMDQKLKNYSSGMQVRLAFSVATMLAESDVLLIDEVLAVGDADFQRKCFSYFKKLKKDKKTVVFVSHDMNAIKQYCDRVILIDNSKLIMEGSPSEVSSAYNQLFVNDKPKENNSPQEGKRWGNNAVVYSSINLPKKINNKDKFLEIVTYSTVKEPVEGLIFGFSIRDESGNLILGTNTIIKNQTVPSSQKGKSIEVVWKIPNIFSDGKYYFSPAIVYDNGLTISDWWDDAASFDVYNSKTTPFLTSPDINLTVTI